MKQLNLVVKPTLQWWRQAPASCLLVIAMSVALCAFTSPAMAARQFTASITPTTATAGQVAAPYTITVTNTSTAGETLGSATITIPSDYTAVILGGTSASGGKSWAASLQAGQIKFRGSGGTDRLSPGQSSNVSFTANVPATAGAKVWTTSTTTNVGDGGHSLTLSGLQPTVTVGPNILPLAVDDSGTTNEDTSLPVAAPGVLANDTDVSPLTAILLSQPASGQVTLNADGSYTYTPNADFYGTDSFTYKANDGIDDSAAATVTITVTAVNDAPVAVADSDTTAEDTALSGASVLGNDTDTENDALTAVLVTGPSNAASFTLNADGTFSYTPGLNVNGTDSFDYKANDGTDDSNTVTVTINITSVNDAPVAVADSDTTAEDTALSGASVLDNDSDSEGDPLTAVLVTGPGNAASFTLNADGTFSYTPNTNFNGTDSFDYKANDGTDDSNTVTVTITVTAVNNAPVAVADSDTAAEDTALSGASVLGNDTDTENDALTAVLVTGPSNAASFTLNADGTFSYTPAANFNGTDSFDYKANDGIDDSNTVTVTITVTAVNDAPEAVADNKSAIQDITLNVAAPGMLGNDTDAENDALTATLDTTVTNGNLTFNADGSFTYVPNAGFSGTDSFTYHANDGGVDGNIATVTINVQKTFTIDGLVRYGNVNPVVGAFVTRTGGAGPQTVQTDSNGRFTFTGVLPGGYWIAPSMLSHTFSPAGSSITVINANRATNFNATRSNQITGRIITTGSTGIGGVTVSRGAGLPAVSNSAGYYTLTNVPNGNHTVSAILAGHTFTPSSRAVTILNNDSANQNFMSGFTITGRVSTSSGVSVAGATVSTGGGLTTVSNSAGYYTIHNVQPGIHVLTATQSGFTFIPATATVTVTNANLIAGPNFVRN